MKSANDPGGSSRSKSGSPFTLLQRAQLLLISSLFALLVAAINATLRFQYEGWEQMKELQQAGRAAILSFWHNQILLGIHVWRKRNIMVMASPHFDGEYTARTIRLFGFQDCRGSSSRGAVRALIQMKRHLALGWDVAFTVDGPRGPRYEVKQGPLWLAKKAKLPIVPFHLQPQKYWELRSWDGFRIPRPFSRVLVKVGPPLEIGETLEDEVALQQYQKAMDDLTEYCENFQWERG